MENDMKGEAANYDEKVDTPRSSGTSEDATSPRPPYALHAAAEDKENDSGDSTTTRQNKSSKKPQSAEPTHSLRAPYAQPVLDASKVDRSKSSVEERLATAKERRLLQRKQLVSGATDEEISEHDMRVRREKEDQAHAKWVQTQEEKRRKAEEGRAKEEAHRREVERRKKQQFEDEKKKAEAKVAKTEQVYEVKLRQKRSASSDRGVKRWSWGGGGGGGGGVSHAETPSPFHYFDATRLTKRTRSSGKDKRLSSLHASHFDVSRLGKYHESGETKYTSQVNLTSSGKSSDRFSHNPYHVNNSHMQFASGLRSYDSRESLSKGPTSETEDDNVNSESESPRQRSSSVGLRSTPPKRSSSMGNIPSKPTPSENTPVKRGRSPTPKGMLVPGSKGRGALSANLAEPIQISPRLLAPTRASLARSRVGEPDGGAVQPTVTDSKYGPMRSRSKDRRVRGHSANRPQTAPGTTDSVPTTKKTRGVSPATKRPGSASALQSLTAPTASSQAKSAGHGKTSEEQTKPKRGVSPQARSVRGPSPKPSRPDSAPARPTQKRNPSPAPTKSSTKASSSEPTKTVAPNIKPALRPALSQIRSKSAGKALSVKIAPEPEKPSRKSTEVKKTSKPTKIIAKKAIKQESTASGASDAMALEIKSVAAGASDATALEIKSLAAGASDATALEIVKSGDKAEDKIEIPKPSDNQNIDAVQEESPKPVIHDNAECSSESQKPVVDVTTPTIDNIAKVTGPSGMVSAAEAEGELLLIVEDSDLKGQPDLKELAPQEEAMAAEATTKTTEDDQLLIVEDSTPKHQPGLKESVPPEDATAAEATVEEAMAKTTEGDQLLIVEDSDPKHQPDLKESAPQGDAMAAEATTKTTEDDQLLIVEDSTPKHQPDLKESVPPEDATAAEATVEGAMAKTPEGDQLLIVEDSDPKHQPDLKESAQQEEAMAAEATDSSHSVNDEEELSESTSISEATVENLNVESVDSEKFENLSQNENQSEITAESLENNLEIVESSDRPEPDIKIAAELGFHLNEPAVATAKATDPSSLSPADSLEEIEQEIEEKSESAPKPEPKEAWNDDDNETIEPSEESTNKQESDATQEQPPLETTEASEPVASQSETMASTDASEPATADEIPAAQSEPVMSTGVQAAQTEVEASVEVMASQPQSANPVEASPNLQDTSSTTEATGIESNATASPEDSEKPAVEKQDEKSDIESPPSSESAPATERKSQPRKNLESEEAKEAYRQAIAEKRRELKEKKEQEERERQERIRLAKIEQAKREEEARTMFEEAAAEAEREKKLEEERQRKREEEEKRREDEATAKKRETGERLKREREMQKQKQEDERLARKKRLEMIMRRTRQPDGDATKSKSEDPASGTSSPVTQSPSSGRSPTVQSPVGGISPLAATTPERSVSPSIAAILNRNVDKSFRTPESEPRLFDNLPNFTNSAAESGQHASTTFEKPVPIDRNNLNSVEIRVNDSNMLGLTTNGRQESSVDDLKSNQDTLIPGL